MSGWVKLHRKITDWEWYQDANTFRVFMHLLLSANHQKRDWMGTTVYRGQCIISADKAASILALSRQNKRRAFFNLQNSGNITIKTTNKFTIVSICNYETYQSCDEENNQQLNHQTTSHSTNGQPTNNQQTTTNKKDKKEKNDKKEEYGVVPLPPQAEASAPPTDSESFSLSGEPKPKPDISLLKKVAELYRECCPSLPDVRKAVPRRIAAVSRIHKLYWKEVDLKSFRLVFEAAEASDFLTGRKPSKTHPNFKADFDWLMNEKNFTNTYEGKYDNNR
jgi:hypothetical protein